MLVGTFSNEIFFCLWANIGCVKVWEGRLLPIHKGCNQSILDPYKQGQYLPDRQAKWNFLIYPTRFVQTEQVLADIKEKKNFLSNNGDPF